MEDSKPVKRSRTCRACGRKVEYPLKGSPATRHHCEDCVAVPAETRLVLERLNTRVAQLENIVRRLQDKLDKPASGPA